jgi:hypothetical protein
LLVLCGNNPSPLQFFDKWMILKGVEVVCFDTLLQVLILKIVRRIPFWPISTGIDSNGSVRDARLCKIDRAWNAKEEGL